MRIADVGNEEFPKARLRALAGGPDKSGNVGGDGNELVHSRAPGLSSAPATGTCALLSSVLSSLKFAWNHRTHFEFYMLSNTFREVSMERRAFLKLLCIGVGVAAAAAPAVAFTSFVPLAAPDHDLDLVPQPGVATSENMERVQVEKAWYGHWRRVGRRHYRRVYRRRYYY